MHTLVSIRTNGAVLIFSTFTALPVHADLAPKWTEPELISYASVVLTGRVARVATGWDYRLRAD